MAFELGHLFFAGVLYLLVLFLIAYATEQGWNPRRVSHHPAVYALSLGVYATSWTFYGSVGYAHMSGVNFLAIYLGVTLAFLLFPVLLAPLPRLAREYQLTSPSALPAVRYTLSYRTKENVGGKEEAQTSPGTAIANRTPATQLPEVAAPHRYYCRARGRCGRRLDRRPPPQRRTDGDRRTRGGGARRHPRWRPARPPGRAPGASRRRHRGRSSTTPDAGAARTTPAAPARAQERLPPPGGSSTPAATTAPRARTDTRTAGFWRRSSISVKRALPVNSFGVSGGGG